MHFRRRISESFHYAYRGIRYAWQHEVNFRIEVIVGVIVVTAGFVFRLERSDWQALLLVILSVLVLELINTAIEILTDLVKPRLHEYVELVKDIMASVVLLASIVAVIIGFIIFVPYIL